jgi:hypothetical protein
MLSSNTKKGEIERAFRLLKVFWYLMTTLGEITISVGSNGFIVHEQMKRWNPQYSKME